MQKLCLKVVILTEAIEDASDEIVQAVNKSKLPKHDATLFFNGILESFNERYPWELQGYAHAMVATAKRYKMNLVKLNRILVEDAMMEGGTAYTESETDAEESKENQNLSKSKFHRCQAQG